MRNAISSVFKRVMGCALCWAVVSCAESESRPRAVEIQAPLTVPLPTVNQFVLLAGRTITLGDRTQVTGGDVGVAPSGNATPNLLTASMDTRVGVGEVVLAQRVVLRERSIAGELGANLIEAPFAMTGPRSPYVPPPIQPAIPAFTAGTAAVNVNPGQTTNLAAGRYGAVNVSGVLNLSGGLYEIQSLRVNPDSRVTANAASTLRVTGGIALADRSRLLPAGAVNAANLRLFVSGNIETNVSVSASTDVQIGGLIVARNVFRAGDRLVATGAVAALDVVVGNDGRIAHNTGFACSSNAQCNDGNPCTADACNNAVCVSTPAANGTACSDGNACTGADSCQAGACVGANPVICTPSDQCHDPGVCDPANGQCSNPAKPNGAACSDGTACTQTDSCQAGACVGANPIVCTASDACHDPGTCNAATGVCSNPARPNGTPCSDGNLCTQTDTCQAGACVGASGVVCPAPDDCHDPGVCDPSSGTCTAPARPDGTACSDGNACTQTDACSLGTCVGTNPVVCTASDVCHAAGACDPTSGACTNPPAPDGTACDDGNACSQGDQCQGGVCGAGGDLAVTEFTTGLPQPGYIVSGPLNSLWFLSPETAFGANNARIAQITTSGAITPTPLFRSAYALLHGPDGLLWIGDTVPGGLPTLGRFSATTRTFVSDFIGIQPQDLVSTTEGGSSVIWYTGASAVGRVTPAGVQLPSVPTFNATRAITAAVLGPTPVVWFTEANTGTGRAFVGRIQFPNLVQFPIETPGELADIVEGPDGGIWFTDAGRNEIARLGANGSGLARYALPSGSGPYAIASGPDGNLWTTLRQSNKVVRVSTTGEMTEVCIPTANSEPTHITAGPDGNIWFTQRTAGKVARISLAP